MASSYIKILFIVAHLLLILLIIFTTCPQYGVDCRPLLLNHDQSRAYELHLQALPEDPAPVSHPEGNGHGHL
ncbi:unnamed protein product [Lupinus luteus]|uniref:Transmembrane protein n=1 Tax=Lupinus luteus TaxID=3873 RepID=A0AAV1WLK8_LUPLU